MSDYHNGEEAYRLAAWLQEGAWHKMTLGDVERAGRLLIKLQERLVSLEKEYDESMVHQNNQYNRRVAERDAALAEVDRLKSEKQITNHECRAKFEAWYSSAPDAEPEPDRTYELTDESMSELTKDCIWLGWQAAHGIGGQ